MTCSCSSDIVPSSIGWYLGDKNSTNSTVLSSGTTSVESITILMTTDDYGAVYVCAMASDCGQQEKLLAIDFTGGLSLYFIIIII